MTETNIFQIPTPSIQVTGCSCSLTDSDDDDDDDERKYKRVKRFNRRLQTENAALRHHCGLSRKERIQNSVSSRTSSLMDNSRFRSVTYHDFYIDSAEIKHVKEHSLQAGKAFKGVKASILQLTTSESCKLKGHLFEANTSEDSTRLAANEQKILSCLGRHPAITSPVGIYRHCGLDYSVIRDPGSPLSISLPPHLSHKAALDLLSAIKHLHQHDIIHSLISPQAIFRSSSDNFVLGFFHLACRDLVALPWIQAQIEFNATGYTAPEIQAGHRPTKASDIFSLGQVLIDLLKSSNTPIAVQALLTECCSADFTRRPNITDIICKFNHLW